ncbi:MAG: hypothetical protein P0111_14375 [Nitrospira sp.]|nr:hypothetical protein [Nitrospira sp.]
MSEFEQVRQQLNQARDKHSEARKARAAANRLLQRLDAQIAQLERRAGEHNLDAVQRLVQLRKDRANAANALKEAETQYTVARRSMDRFARDFFAFSDPAQFVERLDDGIPLLMFPVRIETRFMRSELWVRIYPDDCLIDTFETALSGTEVRAARRYYIESWKAGGIEDQERAAWRGLVGSVGSGRAAWILQQFAPLNAADKPAKARPEAIVLVIAADQPLPLPQNVIADYWRAVWQARGDATLSDTAFQNLAGAPGSSVALAEQIVRDFVPDNIRAWAASAETNPDVALLRFPPLSELDTKNLSWTEPPKVYLFPDRFIFIGQNSGQPPLQMPFNPVVLPLTTGPDPTEAQQFVEDAGDLQIAEDIRWMTDFAAAEAKGLGLKVPLSPSQAADGFERVFVVGIRLSADAERNAADLQDLFTHHLYSRSGFAIVPQGTPTNNTEEATSPFNRTDDPDDSYDVFVKSSTQFTPSADPLRKADGQWLAEWLGLDPAVLQQVPNAGQKDQLEARAINTALWPATWGYYFERMLNPVLDDTAIRQTRSFFLKYVSGRGPAPAVRIGRQPYGILPISPFRTLGWVKQSAERKDADSVYTMRLYELLLKLDTIWRGLADKVKQIGAPGDPDPQQTLLDVLGLHPLCEEVHAVLGEPYNVSYNTVVLGLNGAPDTLKQTPDAAGGLLLRELGHQGIDIPDILSRNYFGRPFQLHDILVDDRPASETAPVREYTPAPAPLNYIGWLLKKGRDSVDDIRREVGFTDGNKPNALLYLFLRQALLLAFERASRHVKRPFVSADLFAGWKAPQTFIHVAAPAHDKAVTSESPWAHLYLDFPQVTGRANYPLAQYIVDSIETLSEADELRDLLAALERLVKTPTAPLERLLREHFDVCHYRLDAWKTGLNHLQLSFMRFADRAENAGARRGIHIGAYGWLEGVKPQPRRLTPVRLEGALDRVFNNAPGQPQLMRDSNNGGFVHAPSLNHAVTAAVLRNGYRATATPSHPDLLSINLSSERVRRSLGLIDGIRNGQKLGALLGYHLERRLHDDGTGLDKFILDLRNQFSLNAQKLKSTQTPNTPVEFIEANNVVDGFALMNFLDSNQSNPDPLAAILPGSTPAERTRVTSFARELFDSADGVADVAMAESVHQVVMGNADRAAATMNAYAGADPAPDPEVVRTPRSGYTLTHRVAIHLRSDKTAAPGDNPRKQGEPSVNDWLADHLPAPDDLGLVVRYSDPAGNPVRVFVRQADLGLDPLDLLFMVNEAATQTATALEDLVLRFVTARPDIRPHTRITLAFTEPEAGKITLFEAMPLLTSLRALLLRSRPLQATDVQLPGEATVSNLGTIRLDSSRIDAVALALTALRTQANTFLAGVEPDATGNILTNLDAHLVQFGGLSARCNLFGVPHAGFAMTWQDRGDIYAAVVKKLNALTKDWSDRLAASRVITTALVVPTGADAPRLREAAVLVSTAALPLDLAPAAMLAEAVNRQNLFEAKLTVLQNITAAQPGTLFGLHQQIVAQLPLTDFDPTAFSLTDQTTAMRLMLDRFVTGTQAIVAEATRRLDAASAAVAAHHASADPVEQVTLLGEAGRMLLGDDFRMIPSFKTTTAAGSEWKNALDASDSLLTYVSTRPESPLPLPVDEWLHGVARVREKMFHLENTVVLNGAFGLTEPILRPLQLPFHAGENWLALEFDPGNGANTLETERLLYTAHYSEVFQPDIFQCGLLVDEWTEVIPQQEEVTGLAFHFDRPNAEPPQVWLLATPAAFTGAWRWNDIVASLNEALDAARTRAVEPDALGRQFAALLPAVLTETSWSPMTISADILARAARNFTAVTLNRL